MGPVGDGGWTFAHDNARKALEKEFGRAVAKKSLITMNRLLTDNKLTVNNDVTYNDITRKRKHARSQLKYV